MIVFPAMANHKDNKLAETQMKVKTDGQIFD